MCCPWEQEDIEQDTTVANESFFLYVVWQNDSLVSKMTKDKERDPEELTVKLIPEL